MAPRRQSPIRLHSFFQLSKLEFQFVELAQLLMAMRAFVSERINSLSWNAKNLKGRQTLRKQTLRRRVRSSRSSRREATESSHKV